MARAYWPDGRSRRSASLRIAGADATAPWLTVIGVVEDVRPFDPNSPQVRQMYLPFAQAPGRALVYFVATRRHTAESSCRTCAAQFVTSTRNFRCSICRR